jgi:tetratricopeptide (TPR) repeat protein
MKNSLRTFSLFILLASLSVVSAPVYAQSSQNMQTQSRTKAKKKTTPMRATPASAAAKGGLSATASNQLAMALKLVQSGQYQAAVPVLYALSRKPEFEREKMQIKYILGSALMELGLNQIAAFQFVEVIKNGNSHYVRQSIEKLSLAADALGDDSLLNYAVSKVRIEDIPVTGRDLIYFRLGEVKLKNGQYAEAINLFQHVPESSRYFFLSRFDKGLAFLELGKTQDAISTYQSLVNYRSNASVTDTNRVVAELGLARSYYQATDWENAIATYREIPRDHPLWHDALFESSWAMLRSARFRSALSNFQSLHSAYYEDSYIPESLLLRSIVYLYICKYDEMAKVLDLFERTYGPVRQQIGDFIANNSEPMAYYNEIENAFNMRVGRKGLSVRLPLKVDYQVLKEGDVKRAFDYLKALNQERAKLDTMTNISRSAVGAVGRKILSNRFKNAKISIGEMVKSHMIAMRIELRDLYEQAGFIRYEMINGEKEQLKKKIAGKDIPKMANESVDRSVYVQNGYEYWPFEGEYWLDEIGNYHYLGTQSCE